MIKELVDRLPLATKINYAVRSLGLTGEDKAEIDSFIDENLNTPLVQLFTSSQITSVESLLSYIWTTIDEGNPRTSQLMTSASGLMANPQLRHVLTDVFLNKVKGSTAAPAIGRALTAISQLPIPGLDKDFPTEKEFIADGLLPLIAEAVQGEVEPVSNFHGVTKCPFCNQVHALIQE